MTTTGTHSGWVKVGVETALPFGLLAAALAIVTGCLVAEPTRKLIETTTGTSPYWWTTAIWSTLVLFLVMAPLLTIFANRPARIDLERRLLRVGWRTIRFDELRHVYRMPAGQGPEMALLQLEIPGGLDARLPLSSDALPDLSVGELEALLGMLEQAPIEPKPGMQLRAPLDRELGPRDATQKVSDAIGDEVMAFTRVSYAKPTLLLEVRRALERARSDEEPPASSRFGRSLSTLNRGASFLQATGGNVDTRSGAELAGASETVSRVNYAKGFFGTSSAAFRTHRSEVEGWLSSGGHTVRRTNGALAAVGGWLIILAFVAPVATFLIVFNNLSRQIFGGTDAGYAAFTISFFSFPLLVWAGCVLVWRGRMRRLVADRSAVLLARGGGATVPSRVQDFFAPPYPGGYFASNLFYFACAWATLLLVAGFVFIAFGNDRVGAPYTPQSWHIPLGIALLLLFFVVLVLVVRSRARSGGVAARARVEWTLLAEK